MSQKIAVTAATGHLGTLVIDELLARVAAEQIVAVARDAEKAKPIAGKGVEVRIASYDDRAALEAALQGVARVLLISGSEVGQRIQQHTNVVEAAKAAGASFIGYTSAPKAADTDLIIAPEHKATEEAIRASGIPYSIMRNNWYVENYVGTIEGAKQTGAISSATNGGKIGGVPRADLAAGHAAVLAGDGHENTIYEFAADEPWTMDDFAAALSDALGRTITHRSVSVEEQASILEAAGLGAEAAGFVAAIDANIADGALEVNGNDLSRIIGRPTTPLRDALEPLV